MSTQLQYLDLGSNALTGTLELIPWEGIASTALLWLDLSHNRLTGNQ